MIYIIILLSSCFSITLQEAFNEAGPNGDYEKYLILEPNQTYTGGVGIYEGDVLIDCQGSIVDLQEQNGIWVYADENYLATLDIQYCNIINGGYYGLSYSGIASGTITNCNFYNNEIGIKPFDYSEVHIENCNFFNNITYGLGIISETPVITVNYSNSWGCENGDYWENCPG